MANPTYYQFANLLEKMGSVDKDFRFMATNDLMTELQKDSLKLDDDTEKRVVKMVLKLLEDKNGEVQNLAVKCLGPLVNKVKSYQVEAVVETLCNNMVSEKEELRDISSIALKTVINDFPLSCNDLISNISHKIISNLIKAIYRQEDTAVQLEALDMIGDIINRFGNHLTSQHNMIEEALVPQIANNRLAVRKRSIVSLSYLTVICSPELFSKIINFLVLQINQNKSSSVTRSYIHCIGVISRTSGSRLAPFLTKIIPLLINFCKKPLGSFSNNGHCITTQQEEDDELREYCLQAFESTIKRCTKEMSPFIPKITDLCLDFIAYDPNYNYEDEEESSHMDSDFGNSNPPSNHINMGPAAGDNLLNNDDESENGENDEYSDDDEDLCWKVRRAGAKCLQCIVESRPDMLDFFYQHVSPVLISRFKEREENVKLDILQVYCTLLKQTQFYFPSTENVLLQAPGVTSLAVVGESMDIGESDPAVLPLLQGQIPPLVKALRKLIRSKSPKIKQGCFTLLAKLSQTLPSSLSAHMPIVIFGILHSLSDDNSASSMKIETLTFLGSLLSTDKPKVFYPYVPQIVSALITAINDPFYKIVSEALTVMEQMVYIIRPSNEKGQLCTNFDFKPYVLPLYNATLNRLCVTDIDQEIKEKAISCMARIINVFGDMLKNELKVCLPIFGDRLKNEITRLAAVKAIRFIVESPFQLDLQHISVDYVHTLGHFLRKNNRTLKINTLLTLETMVSHYPTLVSSEILNTTVMIELPPLISDNDLRMSELVLHLLTTIAQTHPACIVEAWKNRGNNRDYAITLVCELLRLMRSSLLQGEALYSLILFFKNLVKISIPETDFKALIDVIIAPIQNCEVANQDSNNNTIGKRAYSSTSINPLSRPTNALYSTSGTSLNIPIVPQNRAQSETHLHKQALSNIAKVVGAMATVWPIGGPGLDQGSKNSPNPNQTFLTQKFLGEVRNYTSNIVLHASPTKSTPTQFDDFNDPSSSSVIPPDGQQESKTTKIIFALLVLGEVGRCTDIILTPNVGKGRDKGEKNSSPYIVWSLLSDCFSANVEEVKFAAAYALGNIGIGNLERFIPYILNEIGKHPKKQYLNLHALNEVLNGQLGITVLHNERRPANNDDLPEHIPAADYNGSSSGRKIALDHVPDNGHCPEIPPFEADVWSLLLNRLDLLNSPEEGTRSVTAECLGKLCLLDRGAQRVSELTDKLGTSLPMARCTILSAIIYAISSQPDYSQNVVDKVLKIHFGKFLSCLEDDDLNVRRVTLVALNSAAHNKPFLIKDLLDAVMPHLYHETKIRKELIREVEMGPFKHLVDDGLDIRKTAYECMYTLVDSPVCFVKLDMNNFLNHVENGLKDHYDIKMLTYLMLARIATLCPSIVLQRLDRLIDPLKTVLTSKVKANSVKPEYEKQEDLKRCALRAVASLLYIPGSDKNPHAIEFMTFIKQSGELNEMYDTVQKEFLHQQQQVLLSPSSA